MAEHLDIPKDIADNWDDIVKSLHGSLVESRKELRKRTGTRPFLGEKVTSDQKIIEVSGLTEEDWGLIIQKHGKIKEDGRNLLPNKMIKQAKEVQKTRREGEFNF